MTEYKIETEQVLPRLQPSFHKHLPWVNEVSYWPGMIVCAVVFIYAVIGATLCFHASHMIYTLCLLAVGFYLVSAALRCFACFVTRPKDPPQNIELDWPSYTVLVPLYKEAAIVQSLVTHLTRLNYPRDKLEIIFICEADDTETVEALTPFITDSLRASFCTLLRVPHGGPRTKPNALNYALARSQSELVTIYDAEDRPDPQQLKTAARAFVQHSEWEAVQAPLIFYNAHENILTRQFALEYAVLFYVWVPFLARMGLPFPLGGTSNHIRRSALTRTRGWDPYNVTEDADLSFRLCRDKKSLGYISTPTYEEAVVDWHSWHNQRSRWMKGFMQSYNLHMHYPFAPGGVAGLKRNFTLQFTLGATLLAGALHLPFFALLIFFLGLEFFTNAQVQIPPLFVFSVATGYIAGLASGIVGAVRSKQYALIWHIPFMPAYWLALFSPSLKAFVELRTRPFYWNKTKHGVTET